jgi:hypothetical protein
MITKHRKPLFTKLWFVTAVASLALLIWSTPLFAGSFSAGCVGMILNFYVLFNLLEGIFEGDTTKQATYIFLLMGKFLALGLGVFLLIRVVHVDLMAFGLGFFLVAISATYATSTLQK